MSIKRQRRADKLNEIKIIRSIEKEAVEKKTSKNIFKSRFKFFF